MTAPRDIDIGRSLRDLAGQGAVVTGGGRGIGAAVARRLAEAGAAVVVAARTSAEVEGVAGSIRDAGGRAWAAVCDVTDEAAVAALAAEAVERLGRVDILVNNAGMASSSPVHRTTLEDWNRLLAVNATGAFLCTRSFVAPMVEWGRGRIVNVASVAGLHGGRYIAAYAAAKHALVGLTRATAAEVAGRGVTVNAVCPGYVDTAMTDESVARIVEKTGRSAEEARAAILKATPMGRLLAPDEVAAAVLYLCGEAAGGVNGQALVIDGGVMHA
jgi:NAD(P)-dependent dehydrogenase (short-subunit alcohol dehydrogenase family)